MEISSCVSEDYLSSVESVTSGVTSYEDELSEIKSIVSSSSKNNNGYSNKNTLIDYELRIAALKNELKNVRLIYESYKTETSSKNNKIELEAHEKFQKLFHHNILLESQLLNANSCINTTKNKVSVENYELKNEILKLKSDLNIWKNKFENLKLNQKDLKLSIEESNQSLEIRYKVIEDLKIKISELYVELQDVKRKEWKNQADLLGSKSESSRQLKNLQWYKERLLICQNEKVEACKEVIKLKSLISSKNLEISKLCNEKDDWMFKSREAQRELEKSKLEILHKTNLEINDIRTTYKFGHGNKYKKGNAEYLLKITDFIAVLCQISDNFLNNGVLENLFKNDLPMSTNLDVLDTIFAKINKKYENYDIKMNLSKRLKLLEERCSDIKQKSELLETFLKNNFKNAVEDFRILSKVKDMEMAENVKRYEKNVRTLLRKTKEQLKERISLEKKLKHLQIENNANIESINSLHEKLDEESLKNNLLEMEVDRKNCTIDNFNKIIMENESKINEKVLSISQNDKLCFKEELQNKNGFIQDLKKDIFILKSENEKLITEYKSFEEKLVAAKVKEENTNKYLQNQEILFENTNQELTKLKKEHVNCITTIEILESNANDLEERSNYYLNEIEILRSDLKQKEEESFNLNYQNEEIKVEKVHFEKLLTQKDYEINRMYEELRFTNQDKYFYQRLSNDLKIALNSTVKQNEILKEQLYNRSVDAGYHSLSDVTQGPPSVFNENCINDLLLRFNVLNNNKPVKQLKDGMTGLKTQMSLLKQELIAKNFITSN